MGQALNFIETGTIFIKDGKEYHIPKKFIQSQQACKSGLSHYNGKPASALRPTPDSMFVAECSRPHFRAHCGNCGSRLTRNGCSNCGRCHTF